MLVDATAHAPTHMQKHTLCPLYHSCALPFISPLLRATGSKIWFPPHNSLHNVISPALNCQDNLYQSGGESPEWSSSYFSGRQSQTRTGEESDHFHKGKARDPSVTSARRWCQDTLREKGHSLRLVIGRTLQPSMKGAACRLGSSI